MIIKKSRKGVYTRGQNSKHEFCRGPVEDVFPKRIDKDGPIHPVCGQCWVYKGSLARSYGQFRGKKAHRISYELYVGRIPENLLVLHRCDNPSCVNPAHLFLGTHQDNMDDKIQKGRQGESGTKTPPVGEKNVKAKLTEAEVRLIRKLYRHGSKEFGSVSLGKRFRVATSNILRIVKRKGWTHI